MAERLGTVFVELEIDDSKFTRSERKILDEARSTSLSIEKNWRVIGEKSDLMYTAMQQRAINAYEAIKNNAKASADEQIRAQAQMVAKINSLNMEMARNPLFETLGVKSVAAIEAQKKAIILSYETIKASGQVTATDLVNIEAAKVAKIKALNEDLFTQERKLAAERKALAESVAKANASDWSLLGAGRSAAAIRAEQAAVEAAYLRQKELAQGNARDLVTIEEAKNAKMLALNQEIHAVRLAQMKQETTAAIEAAKAQEAAVQGNWNNLGIRSQAAIEAQKAAVMSSYDAIKASGTATAQDLINIERAKNDRLKELNKEMVGEHEMSMAAMTRAILRFYAAYYVVSNAIRAVADQITSGLEAIDKMQIASVSIAAQMTQYTTKQNIGEAYKEALIYAKGLVPVLEKIDEKSFANVEQIQDMTRALGNYGIFIDRYNEKQVSAFTSLSNMIKLYTSGQPNQFFQEMNGVLEGIINKNNRVATQLDNQIKMEGIYRGGLKEVVDLGLQHKDLLQRLEPYLKGINEAGKDIEGTWEAIKSSLQTTWNILQRDIFKDVYVEWNKEAKDLNEWLRKNSTELSNHVTLGYRLLAIFGNLVRNEPKKAISQAVNIYRDWQYNKYTEGLDYSTPYDPGIMPDTKTPQTSPFETLGIKTAKEYDDMRNSAIKAYTDIKNSAASTAADIIAAEEAKTKRLKEIDEQQYAGAKERARQASEEQRKTLAEQKKIEDQLWKEAVRQADELRRIKEISSAEDLAIAKLKLEQEKQNAADTAQAYRAMYKDLKGFAKEYYDFELQALEEQRNAFFETITKGKHDYDEIIKARAITDAWYANEKKKLDRDLARSTGDMLQTMSASWDQFYDDQLNISRTMYDGWLETNNAILDDGTQVLKKGLKGNFDDIGDAWDNLMYHMKDIFYETVARIAMQKIMINFGSPVLNGVTSAVTGATGSFLSSTGLSALFNSAPAVGVAGQNSTFWEAGAASSGLGSLVAPLAGIAAGMYGMYEMQKQFNADDSWKNVLKTFAANPIQGSVNAVLKVLGLSGGGKKAEWYGLTVHDITDEGVIMSSKARKGSNYDYAPGTSNIYELTASTAALKEYYAVLESYPSWVMEKEQEQLRSTIMEQYHYVEGKTKWYEDLKKNVDAALAASLTEGLEEYESQINEYYSQLGEQAGSMFASAMGTAMQSGSFNTFFDAFKQQMLSVYQDSLVSGFTSSAAYQNIMGPFLDALNTSMSAAQGSSGVWSPTAFQQSITPILNQTLQKLEDMVPAFKAIYDALGGIDVALSGGKAAQIESIFASMDTYIDSLTAAMSPLDSEIKQITDTFEPWLEQLYAIGASGDQINDATNEMMNAIDLVAQKYRENAQSMVDDFLASMSTSDLAPTVSKEAYDRRIQELMSSAQSGDTEALSDLFNFVKSEYLPFYKSYAGAGSDYNEIYQSLFGVNGILANYQVQAPTITIDTRNIGEAIKEAFSSITQEGTYTFNLKIDNSTLATSTVQIIRNSPEVREEIRLIG
jgi:hypothetical protein